MIELTGYQDKHEYVNKHGVKSVVYLMDCMDAMAQMGANEFSLGCVDPPYGIGEDGGKFRGRKGQGHRVPKKKNWDSKTPDTEYFDALMDATVNQVIWGGNYFPLPPSKCWLFWDKLMGGDFADGELAWTSFNSVVRKFTKCNKDHGHIHPTQKPIALYDWIFHNYAKPNDSIFDSHCESGSSRIAADKHNLPYLATELDPDYFRDHCKRFDRYTAQQTLF